MLVNIGIKLYDTRTFLTKSSKQYSYTEIKWHSGRFGHGIPGFRVPGKFDSVA